MDPYSITLVVAILLTGIALAIGLLALVSRHKLQSGSPTKLTGIARWCAWLSLPFLGGSVIVHLFNGHRPGTATALPFQEFVNEHPAFLITGAAIFLALWLLNRTASRRQQ